MSSSRYLKLDFPFANDTLGGSEMAHRRLGRFSASWPLPLNFRVPRDPHATVDDWRRSVLQGMHLAIWLPDRYDFDMSRTIDPNEYVLCFNLKDGPDVRRFCEVRVKGNDVYIYQPKKGELVKVSYHESGQRHVKVGIGAPIMPPMQLDPTEAIITEEKPWSKSFENFKDLLPYSGQPANDTVTIDLPPLPYGDSITFAQISIGRSFAPDDWSLDGVDQVTTKQEVFAVPQSSSGLQVCVRILRLQHSA